MKIGARVENGAGEHRTTVTTNGASWPIDIPPKMPGDGSGVNGGELLFLALATCYCNDLYREAERGITVGGWKSRSTGCPGRRARRRPA